MSEPRTEAGKYLAAQLDSVSRTPYSGVSFPGAAEDIAAIEAEAAQQVQAALVAERDALRAAIENLLMAPPLGATELADAEEQARALLTGSVTEPPRPTAMERAKARGFGGLNLDASESIYESELQSEPPRTTPPGETR